MSTTLLSLITYYASLYGVEPRLAQSVMQVESRGNQYARGTHGEIGVFQILPQYVDKYVNLYDVEDNVIIGVKMLSNAKKHCKHKESNKFVICFNRGVVGGSKVNAPENDTYYKSVKEVYAKF